jgi:hypothetical protein
VLWLGGTAKGTKSHWPATSGLRPSAR